MPTPAVKDGNKEKLAEFHAAWSEAERQIAEFIGQVDEGPATPDHDLASMHDDIEQTFHFSQAMTPHEAVRQASRLLRTWATHTSHRRHFGLFNPEPLPVTIAADGLVAAFNPQLATVHHGPGAIAIERRTLRVFQEKLGQDPATSAANFTNAGAEANHSAILCALTRAIPMFDNDGLVGQAKRPVFYVSAEAHHSFIKIAHAVGIGRSAVREVPVGPDFRMLPPALDSMIRTDSQESLMPFAVVATAGTTGVGAIDPIPEVAQVARMHGLWLHVDAAWGGGALLSPVLIRHLDGIEHADSVTIDAHKWLSVPMAGGMFFCRDAETVSKTFRVAASYMPIHGGLPDPFGVSIQWSRRCIGLKLALSMAVLGMEGYAKILEHQAAMGDCLREKLTSNGWKIVNSTPLPLANYTHPRMESGERPLDEVLQRVNRGRKVWISKVRLSTGVEALRTCITNYRTQPEDLDVLLEELNGALR